MEAELTKEGSEEEVAAFLRNKVGIDEGKIESMKGHTKLKGRMNGKLLFMANTNLRDKIDTMLEEDCAWDDFDTGMMWSAIDELKDENKGSAMAAVAAKAATEAVAAQSTSSRPAKRAKKDEGPYKGRASCLDFIETMHPLSPNLPSTHSLPALYWTTPPRQMRRYRFSLHPLLPPGAHAREWSEQRTHHVRRGEGSSLR